MQHSVIQPAKSLVSKMNSTLAVSLVVFTGHISMVLRTRFKITDGVTVTNLSLPLFISCEFYLPKTKSIVSGTARLTTTASSLAARSVLSLARSKVCTTASRNAALLA
jgi:hypothetical protein